jgi:hypothetical protein
MTDMVTVGRAKRDPSGLDVRRRKAAPIADPKARESLRKADPILGKVSYLFASEYEEGT